MSEPRPLPRVSFCTAAGNGPVREWLKSLTVSERKQIAADIRAVQFGWPLGLPLVDFTGHGLWKVRTRLPSRIAPTIFCGADETIIRWHGFIKKIRATPDHEPTLARKRKTRR